VVVSFKNSWFYYIIVVLFVLAVSEIPMIPKGIFVNTSAVSQTPLFGTSAVSETPLIFREFFGN
jgi:hypothetical protein